MKENNLLNALKDDWLSLVVSIVIIGVLWFLARKRVSFGYRVLIALGLGLIAGIFFNQGKYSTNSVSTIGTFYVDMVKMIVIPLVAAAIITSITSLSNITQLRKLGVKTVAWFLGTTAIAAIIGLIVALIVNPGAGITQAVPKDYKARAIPTFWSVITDQLPTNPVSDAANGKVIPIIIFALFLAVAIVKVGAKKPEVVKPVKDFIESFLQVMFQVTKYVVRLTPYGVYALIAVMAAKYGWSTLEPLIKVVAATYAALLLHFILTFGGLVTFVAKVNPFRFFRKAYPTIAVAFTTRSSYVTLPVNLEVITKRIRVSQRVASFVAPLGATINMNGCGGVWPAIVAIFVAKVYGISLGVTDYILIVLAAVIASVGVAGVPGPASISTTVVLTALGLPIEGLGLVLAIDAVVDMGRTAVNATGTTVCSLLVAESEGEFDREAFNRDEDDQLELNIA